MSARRGGIPGPDRRTALVRPAMTEAEFERQQAFEAAAAQAALVTAESSAPAAALDPEPSVRLAAVTATTAAAGRARSTRGKPAKPRRVQRMFAVEEDLDKKLWLYAIHVGKDRSDVVNDLLRPLVASMVLYDSRDRRAGAGRMADSEGQGTATEAESA